MGQLLRLEQYREAKLKSLKSEYRKCENTVQKLEKKIASARAR